MEFEKISLGNNLPLLLVPMPESEVTAVLFLVRAGSRYETPETNGLSRLYANMCLKKTKSYFDRLALAAEIDKIGAVFNLEVHKEYTAFYLKALNKHFDKILQIISEITIKPPFDVNELSREKKYFASEIANRKSDFASRTFDELNKLVFGEHSLSYSGVGEKEAVEKFKLDNLITYGQKHYNTANSLLIVSGQTKDVKTKVETAFKDLSQGKKAQFNPFDPKKLGSKTKLIEQQIPRAYFALGFPAMPRQSQQRFAQILLDIVLGKTKSNNRLVKISAEETLAFYVRSGVNMFSDIGLLTIQMASSTQNKKKAYQRVLEELEKFKNELIPQKDLDKAKGYYQGTLAMSITEPVERGFFYGLQAFLDEKILTQKEFFDRIHQTTSPEIQKLANLILDQKRLNVVMLGQDT